MHSPTRDPVREYQKQKEKLALIGLECTIEWTKKTILTRKAEASQLNDELGDIHQYLQALEDEEGMILENLSQQSAWTNSEGQRRTLKLLDLNSK
jgi:septal ring factor EnvC (AmiA/AmiB activator)